MLSFKIVPKTCVVRWGFGAGPKEHWWHSVGTTEIANLQFLRFSYCQRLRPSLTPQATSTLGKHVRICAEWSWNEKRSDDTDSHTWSLKSIEWATNPTRPKIGKSWLYLRRHDQATLGLFECLFPLPRGVWRNCDAMNDTKQTLQFPTSQQPTQLQLFFERVYQSNSQRNIAILGSFSFWNKDLTSIKVNILVSESTAFHQPQTGTIHNACHDTIYPNLHCLENQLDFINSQYDGQIIGQFGSLSMNRDLGIEHSRIEKE